MYAIDAKFSILIKITAIGGPLSSGGPDVDLEADVVEGPVRESIVDQYCNLGLNLGISLVFASGRSVFGINPSGDSVAASTTTFFM